MMKASADLLLKDFQPRSMLKRPAHVPEKARFPVVDAHNHIFGESDPAEMVRVMDEVGVKTFVNATGNACFPIVENCYTVERRDLHEFIGSHVEPYPGRFCAFTMSEFARWDDLCIFRDDDFVEKTVAVLEEDVEKGACGFKVTKELGLKFTDNDGSIVPVDDSRLDPVWKRAGEMGLPVLIHTSDPEAFFLPADRYNEHYLTLHGFPSWSFHGSQFSKRELLDQRERMIARHPGTIFICPHVGNYSEDLGYVARLLEEHPNIIIDLSARMDELGRQPYSSREFIIRYQDRILFGTDMPISAEIYRCHFRFLETRDEYFEHPDYIGRWGHSRWMLHGLYLPDGVLKKIYFQNACRVIPTLAV